MKEMNMKVGDRKRLMLALGLVEAPAENTRNNLCPPPQFPASENAYLITNLVAPKRRRATAPVRPGTYGHAPNDISF